MKAILRRGGYQPPAQRIYSTFLKKFGELDGVEYQTYFDNGGILRSKDIVLMYYIKKFVELCKEECKATLSTPLEYMKKYCNSNGYLAQKFPIITNLFKEEAA